MTIDQNTEKKLLIRYSYDGLVYGAIVATIEQYSSIFEGSYIVGIIFPEFSNFIKLTQHFKKSSKIDVFIVCIAKRPQIRLYGAYNNNNKK